MKNTRNHERAPGMAQTSVALPKLLLDRIQYLADRTDRSRNKMINRLLREAVATYDAKTSRKEKPDA